ncbi:MAG: ligand-binding sensor domain-containing protein/signal transduction histidine kinase [Phenylobacterium sp.]|jgi:ligand-binding sensor domain-containing protein/signal transduction histidine kinase
MRFLISLFIFFHAFTTLAAGPVTHFDRLSLEHGLSQAVVNSIVQDRKGFLWFATQDGLNRYDGYNFKVFRHDPQNPASISHNWTQTLLLDSKGTLWVGTYGGGLNRFDSKTERFIHYKTDETDPNSITNDSILAIEEDRKGNLWIGTYGGGLNKFDPSSGQFEHYRHSETNPNTLINDRVFSIYQDKKGLLWLGTSGGLDNLDPATDHFNHYQSKANDQTSLSSNRIYTIHEDSNSVLWVGTRNGLNRFDGQHFQQFLHQDTNPNSLSHNYVKTLFEDNTGTLWVGTRGGLNRYDAQQNRFVGYHHENTDPHSLSNDFISSIHQDNQGVLWIGTFDGGISKLDIQRQGFGHFKSTPSDPHSLSHPSIKAVYKDPDGPLWLGTDDGLNLYDEKTQRFTHFKHNPTDPGSLSHNRIRSIYKDSNATLWVGTYGGGLDKRVNGQFKHFKHNPDQPGSLSNDIVMTIFEDSKSTLWIGTYGGLNQYNPQTGKFIHYNNHPDNPYSLSDDTVTTIFEDSKDILWIGTEGGGLNRFDRHTKRFTFYQHIATNPHSLSNDAINTIVEDSQGTLWIGTKGGLNKLNSDGKGFNHYREKEGLANDNVYGIVEDNIGNLWLSTNKGLSRFHLASATFRNFDANDGLQSNEFNQNAYFKCASGELFFGGINGFNRFYPHNIKDNQRLPNIVLTDFLLANQSVPINPQSAKAARDAQEQSQQPTFALPGAIDSLRTLVLDYQQNLISFEFTALDFTNPQKNQYAWQLEGQDKDWILTDSKKRWATYTNLRPGRYTLRIKASNSQGYWNKQGKSLNIIVLPAPWETWWAYSFYALCLTALMYSYVHAQRRKIRYELKLNAQLESQVLERTARLEQKNHEVEQKNHQIIDTQQQLVQAEKMAALGTLTAGIAHEINNPTNFAHLSTQNLQIDLGRFERFLFKLAEDDADQKILNSFKAHFEPLHRHLDTIKTGTERIKVIVQDLRAFTQLDSAEQKTVKITDLLQSTVNLVHTQYLKITEITTDFDAHPQLLCYPAQLNQVFMNLIVNACDAIKSQQQHQASPVHGQITISCQMLENTVEISVKDNGGGMSDETKNKLFEPFYTTKDVGEGTGLGLSIAFGIVQKHGGEFIVESQLGVGSTFTVLLACHHAGLNARQENEMTTMNYSSINDETA